VIECSNTVTTALYGEFGSFLARYLAYPVRPDQVTHSLWTYMWSESQSGYTARDRPPNVLVATGRLGGRDAPMRGPAAARLRGNPRVSRNPARSFDSKALSIFLCCGVPGRL